MNILLKIHSCRKRILINCGSSFNFKHAKLTGTSSRERARGKSSLKVPNQRVDTLIKVLVGKTKQSTGQEINELFIADTTLLLN